MPEPETTEEALSRTRDALAEAEQVPAAALDPEKHEQLVEAVENLRALEKGLANEVSQKQEVATDGGRVESESGLYHVTDSGTKWPNCLSCGSEDTSVVPATDEWTCQDCGRQWHPDEHPAIDDGDADDIGAEIEALLRSIADESPGELARVAVEKERGGLGD